VAGAACAGARARWRGRGGRGRVKRGGDARAVQAGLQEPARGGCWQRVRRRAARRVRGRGPGSHGARGADWCRLDPEAYYDPQLRAGGAWAQTTWERRGRRCRREPGINESVGFGLCDWRTYKHYCSSCNQKLIKVPTIPQSLQRHPWALVPASSAAPARLDRPQEDRGTVEAHGQPRGEGWRPQPPAMARRCAAARILAAARCQGCCLPGVLLLLVALAAGSAGACVRSCRPPAQPMLRGLAACRIGPIALRRSGASAAPASSSNHARPAEPPRHASRPLPAAAPANAPWTTAAAPAQPADERFIGWTGETYRPVDPAERVRRG
jgi:hypothetical protein